MSVQKLAISLRYDTIRYLRKVQRISSEFLADMPNDLSYILCCDWNFSPRVNSLRDLLRGWHNITAMGYILVQEETEGNEVKVIVMEKKNES